MCTKDINYESHFEYCYICLQEEKGKEDSFIAAKSSTRQLDCAHHFKMRVLSDSRGKTRLMCVCID
jgi:hypothetical protein